MEVFLYDKEDKLITNFQDLSKNDVIINKIVIKQEDLAIVSRTGVIGYEVIKYPNKIKE